MKKLLSTTVALCFVIGGLFAQKTIFDTSFVFNAELNYLYNTKDKVAGSVYQEFTGFVFTGDTIITSASDISGRFVVDSIFYWENKNYAKDKERTSGYKSSNTVFYLKCRDSDNDSCGIALFRINEFKPYKYRIMVIYRDWFMAYLSK